MNTPTLETLRARQKEINKIMSDSEKYTLAYYREWVAAGNVRRLTDEYLQIEEKINKINSKS